MNSRFTNVSPFLTERERLIAEQVRKLKDLPPRRAVTAGAAGKVAASAKPSDSRCHIHPN